MTDLLTQLGIAVPRPWPSAVSEKHNDLGPPVGLWPNVDEAEYHAGPGLGSTDVKQLLRSPAHFRAYRNREAEETTPAKILGSAMHIGILQPWLFDAFVVQGLDLQRRSKADKSRWAEFEAENAGRVIVPFHQWDHVRAVIDAVGSDRLASTLLTTGDPELSMYWTDSKSIHGHEPTYRLCKGRIDWCDPYLHNLLVDLKSAEDASYGGFRRTVLRYGYHIQAAYYLHGYELASKSAADDFVFVVFEKVPPYAVACYTLPADLIHLGRTLVADAMTIYDRARDTDEWPAYPSEIRELEMAPWMLRREIM